MRQPPQNSSPTPEPLYMYLLTRLCRSERAASRRQLLSDVCDLTIPVSALGWVGLDDGLVGLAGTLTSIIGVQAQWRKTA